MAQTLRQAAPPLRSYRRQTEHGIPLSGIATRTPPSRRKHLGAFYTPRNMAAVLVDWAIRSSDDTVLDPSFGGLVFLTEAERRLGELGSRYPARQLYGCDLDEEASAGARTLAAKGATVVHRDFLRTAPGGRVLPRATAVVGNPPYVRYQTFQEGRERGRAIAARHGVHLTALASSWAPLLIHAADFVSPGGRLAQVLPAELIHAQYAEQVLESICAGFGRVVVVLFDEHVFPGAQEEVVLLLAEGRACGPAPGVEIVTTGNVNDLEVPTAPTTGKLVDPRRKLLLGLVDPEAIALCDRLMETGLSTTLGSLASVDIGAVTGANDFFVRPAVELSEVPDTWLRPTVSKAAHVRGARITQEDFAAMDESRIANRMLVIAGDSSVDGTVADLIAEGERNGVHKRYKCRIRTPWWSLPPRQVARPPELFLTYMASKVPRLVVNEAQALSTNTVHGVKLLNGADPAAVAASFYSSLTMLSAELVGRSYGGGVLKLEPTEAERLAIPRPAVGHKRLLRTVDELVRGRRYDELQTVVDEAILVEDLGIAREHAALLRSAAASLRSRRSSRAARRSAD